MREIVQELNLAQKVEVDGLNGFSRLKLYRFYNGLTPDAVISCHQRDGIQVNYDAPADGNLKFPSIGPYRNSGQRTIWVKDFVVTSEPDSRPGLGIFKQSFLHIELTLTMDQDVFINGQTTTEDHYFHRGTFLGHAYIMKKLLNDVSSIS